MRSEVIVCTKDRPQELLRCIRALEEQERVPDRVIVVDSSRVRVPIPLREPSLFPLVHVESPPGLTHQRNIGLDLVDDDTDVVHFLDDDAVPEPGYVGAMNDVFRRHDDASGAGAKITNLPAHKPWAAERFFGLNSRRQGALLKSGVNVLSFDGVSERPVDWLSGCCMSFRQTLIEGLRFDERRTGNGLGEDVEFSARARTRGPLIWTPHARIAHLQSMTNRDDNASVVRRDVLHRWDLAVRGVGGVSRFAVIYATAGLVAIQVIRAARQRSLLPVTTARAAARGLIDVLAGSRI